MRTTLDLPDNILREIKLRAVVQRRTVKDLVTEFLRQGLGMAALSAPEPPATNSMAMIEIGPNGLPVIRCDADAPARRMTANQLLQLEQAAQEEEDLQRAGLSV